MECMFFGYPGDYIDITNHRVVSAKTFHKSYQILENDQISFNCNGESYEKKIF